MAVITTFDPDFMLIERLKLLDEKNINSIILIDDSGIGRVDLYMSELSKLGVIVIKNSSNLGIAASLNVGFEKALELKADFVLTLDDDSGLSTTYVSTLMSFLLDNSNEKVVACGVIQNEECLTSETNSTNTQKRNLITSGCIYPVSVISDIGFFNEDFFIDLVDFEFCTRLRRAGYALFEVPLAKMTHTIGSSVVINLLGMDVIVYNHNPFRLYYQIRNVYLYIYKYLLIDPLYCAYLLINVIKVFIKIIFFESNKLARLKFYLKGTFHGLINSGGRL
ncbi:glycosyltransferase [Shewanella sp. HL-SH5]|uniref:glycosyltransferase n=1 Tax=Shewanella sp. HL-SH5 TaxID=3436241 RepID=UPI003EBB10DB